MSANIEAVLARLDEMNNGEINYDVYRELHDLVSAIEDDVQAPVELFPGTLEALNALSIRDRTTSPDAATAAIERVRALVSAWQNTTPASGPFPERAVIDVDVEIIAPLLAALDGAPEPEWEWGVQYVPPSVYAGEPVSCASERAARMAIRGSSEPIRLHRRHPKVVIPAGPWLPVGGENNGE